MEDLLRIQEQVEKYLWMFDKFKLATRLLIFRLFNTAPYQQSEAIKVVFKISLWQEFNNFFSLLLYITPNQNYLLIRWKKWKLHKISEIFLWNLSYFLSVYNGSCNIFFLSLSNNPKDKNCNYIGALEVMQRVGKLVY